MRVTYTWTEREWREAVAVAERKANRRPMLPGLTWALILLPLIGGVGDLVVKLRHSHLSFAGSLVPLLLILFATVAAMLFGAGLLRRRKRAVTTMPQGDWEAVLQETGWRFSEKAEGAAAQPIRPWDDITEARRSEAVIVLVCLEGFHAIPARSLTPEQGGHLHRLVARKVRPSAPARAAQVENGDDPSFTPHR